MDASGFLVLSIYAQFSLDPARVLMCLSDARDSHDRKRYTVCCKSLFLLILLCTEFTKRTKSVYAVSHKKAKSNKDTQKKSKTAFARYARSQIRNENRKKTPSSPENEQKVPPKQHKGIRNDAAEDAQIQNHVGT